MSSLEEEEKFVQMVHDFIESSEDSESSYSYSSSSKCFFSLHQKHQPSYHLTLLQEILRSGTADAAEKEVLEFVKEHLRSRRETQKSSSGLKTCLVKKLKMEGFNASLCHTSWSTSLGCPAGEYEYIDIILEDDHQHQEPKRLIVDIDFKSQFELARPTTAYKELTNTLPTIFVGKEEKLNKIITLLCSAAKQSLKERGLHFPPWRTATYMQSKWLSECQKFPATIAESTSHEQQEQEGVGKISVVGKKKLMGKKRSDFGNGGGSGGCSGLSSQFAKMGINCC